MITDQDDIRLPEPNQQKILRLASSLLSPDEPGTKEDRAEKEREVLELIAAGKTNREMADTLGLSVRAVEDCRSRLMKKVNANSVAELVRLLSARGR